MALFSVEGSPNRKRRRGTMLLQLFLIAGSFCLCDAQIPTSVPTDDPTRAPARASASPSTMPTSSLRSAMPSTVPSSFSKVPSQAPSSSLQPSTSEAPSVTPSTLPSLRPSASAGPSSSVAPSYVPSFLPSQIPSMVPSVSLQPSVFPSFHPSSTPTNGPSDTPTEIPSNVPSVSPSLSIQPSVAPSDMPSQVPSVSLAPSSGPSLSFQPSDSSVPSSEPSSRPTSSEAPSNFPSELQSAGPSNVPSFLPSQLPSNLPTVTLITVSQSFITMIFEGLMTDFSPNEVLDWEIATSDHVRQYWNNLAFTPIFVGVVETRFLSQDRLGVAPIDNKTAAPLRIQYEQDISFGYLGEIEPEEETIFLFPFRFNSQPYVEEIVDFTDNQGPVFLLSIDIETPQPTLAPIPAPLSDDNDRQIIFAVVFCVGFAVLVAVGYLWYLTRKDRLRGPIVPMISEDFSDHGDTYYVDTAIQSPSSTQVVANIDPTNSFESDLMDSSPSARSGYSDARLDDEPFDNTSETGPFRERTGSFGPMRERAASYPSPTVPVIAGAEHLIHQHASSGSIAAYNQESEPPSSPPEEVSPTAPSMLGFDLQIEDLED